MIAVLSAEISTNEYITGGFVMDWATLIVGILSFAGILLILITLINFFFYSPFEKSLN